MKRLYTTMIALSRQSRLSFALSTALMLTVATIASVCFSQNADKPNIATVSDVAAGKSSITTVENVAALDLSQIAQQSQATWVVLQTIPDVPGSTIVEQPAYVDHKHKRIVDVGSESKPLVKGQYKVLVALTKPPQEMSGRYRWETRLPNYYRYTVGSPDKDWFFINESVLVCRINDELQGSDRYEEIDLIPALWQEFVKPALEFYQANAELFDAKNVAQNETRLRELLDDPNPLTAIAACKVLNQAFLLDAEFVRSPLTRARGLRQAVFAMLLTKGGPNQMTPDKTRGGAFYINAHLAPEAEKLAQTATVASLKNLALGVYTARVSTVYDPFKRDERVPLPGFGPTLLRDIAQRTQELKLEKPRSQDERDLINILKDVGLR